MFFAVLHMQTKVVTRQHLVDEAVNSTIDQHQRLDESTLDDHICKPYFEVVSGCFSSKSGPRCASENSIAVKMTIRLALIQHDILQLPGRTESAKIVHFPAQIFILFELSGTPLVVLV